jgi:hypothetical protein
MVCTYRSLVLWGKTVMSREEKIQEAMKNAEAKWDEKYSQEDWEKLNPPAKEIDPNTPDAKWKRVGKGFASKAMKNAY